MPLTRRDFTCLGTLGLAAGLAPRFALPQTPFNANGRKVGYAVIGLGRIASHFIDGVRHSANSRITALVSGHREKALQWAAAEAIPESSIYSYENFDQIAKNPEVDAVYVALPNSMHAEYTLRAARASKHVLCEKPMACSVTEAEQMIEGCRRAKVRLMIAYRCHYEPTNLRAVALLRSGALGRIQSIESAFGFNCPAGDWRLDRKLSGGGPMFDVGIYSLNACRYLTGEEPAQIAAFSSVLDHDGRFVTVEENLSWTMKFPSGVVAACNTTFGGSMEGYFRVHGSDGWLEVENAFSYEGLRLRAGYGNTLLDEPNGNHDPSHFQAEAEHFSDCILKGHEAQSPGEEGLRDMRLIEQIFRSAGIAMKA